MTEYRVPVEFVVRQAASQDDAERRVAGLLKDALGRGKLLDWTVRIQPAPRLCVEHRAGWCAVKGNEYPPEGKNAPTVCEHWIWAPGRYEVRVPDCPHCLVELARG
jgi:hypothetical protein